MKTLAAVLLTLAFAGAALAQSAPAVPDVRQTHYQIGVMERVLEGAVEHGAANLRERLQTVFPDAPAQLLILDNPRVRGFRLNGYGVFFDVEVPSLNATLTWSLQTLDKGTPTQTGPATVPASSGPVPVLPNPRRPGVASAPPNRTVRGAAVQPGAVPPPVDEKILENPNEEYRNEVVQALADAMLDYSAPLAVGADEWLTIGARGIQDPPRVGPPDNDAQTVMIQIKGSDLQAFRAGQMSRDEMLRRIQSSRVLR